jgi:hypothetical protein
MGLAGLRPPPKTFSRNQDPLKTFGFACASTEQSARAISCDLVGSSGHAQKHTDALGGISIIYL